MLSARLRLYMWMPLIVGVDMCMSELVQVNENECMRACV